MLVVARLKSVCNVMLAWAHSTVNTSIALVTLQGSHEPYLRYWRGLSKCPVAGQRLARGNVEVHMRFSSSDQSPDSRSVTAVLTMQARNGPPLAAA